MKLKSIYIIGLLIIIMTGCGRRYKYWDISKFNIDNNALEDDEEIKLVYTSRGPDNNRNLEYYFHLIAISLKTGDTINILTTADNGLTMGDIDKVFIFFNKDHLVSKLTQMDIDTRNKIKHLDDIKKIEIKKIEKIARDPNYDYLADNNFPTIIGSIGTMTKINE